MLCISPGMDEKTVFQTLIFAGGLYLLYGLAMFGMQRSMMYPGQQLTPLVAADAPLPAGIERIWLQSPDGPVESWFIRAAGTGAEPRPSLIVAHGNYELIEDLPGQFAGFTDLGLNLLLVEFPGYGHSAGRPSQASITATMLVAYDTLLTRKEVDPGRVMAYGRSLGAGASCALAAQRPLAALILQSAFTSARSFAKRYLLPGRFVRDPFENLPVVRDFSNPVLLLHGRHDAVIPYAHAQALAEANQAAQLISYACGHNDCPPDWPRYWQDVENFLTDNGLLPQP